MRPEPPTREEDRAAIASFLATRSEESFRVLYRAHAAYLYAIALRLAAGRRDVADDLVQETWVRAVEHLDGFEGRSALRTWLAGILIRCAHEGRRAGREVPFPDDATEKATGGERPAFTGATGRAPEGPGRADLERALAGIAPELREVVLLHDLYGFTHAEIGTEIGIAAGTSKSRLHFARRALAARLGAPADGPRPLPVERETR